MELGIKELDKRIPVTVIIGLIIQAMVVGAMYGVITNKVETNQKAIIELKSVDIERNKDMIKIEGRLSGLESNSEQQLRGMQEIKRMLERGYMRNK